MVFINSKVDFVSNSLWSSMTGKYDLMKTLRFELKPVYGTTFEDLNEQLEKDKKRAEEFKQAKKILLNFYKNYLEENLPKIKPVLKEKLVDNLKKIEQLYFELKKVRKKDYNVSETISEKEYELLKRVFPSPEKVNEHMSREKYVSEIKKLYDSNIKNIKKSNDKNAFTLSSIFKNNLDKYSLLTKKEIFKSKTPFINNYISDEEKLLLKKFYNWTTYFRGFFENMNNVFSENSIDKSTSIFYRIINDNLIIFLENKKKVEEIKFIYDNNEDFKKVVDENISKIFSNSDFETIFGSEDVFKPFFIENYFEFIDQKGINFYNFLIGGDPSNKNIKGLNILLNEFSQKINGTITMGGKNFTSKNIKKLKLTKLKNQILSSEEKSFRFEEFNSQIEILEKIKEQYESFDAMSENLRNLFKNIDSYDTKSIYFKQHSKLLSDLSVKLFGYKNFYVLKNILREYFINNDLKKTEESLTKKDEKLLDSFYKKHFSIYDLNDILNWYYDHERKIPDEEYYVKKEDFILYFIKNDILDEDLEKEIKESYNELKVELLDNYDSFKEKKFSEKETALIKKFLDKIIEFSRSLKLFDSNSKEEADFYEKYDKILEYFKEWNVTYNKIRNFVTKKPYSTKKIKVTFENQQLLTGWDVNKENDYLHFLFREYSEKLKGYKYYLGILKKDLDSKEKKEILKKLNENTPNSSNNLEKLLFESISDPVKTINTLFFIDGKVIRKTKCPDGNKLETCKKDLIPREVYVLLKKNKNDLTKDELQKIISYYKELSLGYHEWKRFNFSFKEEYSSPDEFFKDLSFQGLSLNFININKNYVLKLVENKKLFLFQIYNKDFSENKIKKENYSSKKNIHTLYWNALFSKENLTNKLFSLGGDGELFFREKSLPRKVTHKKNHPIENKLHKDNIDVYTKKESEFNYDLIKNKRYTEDKLFLHVPIKINFYFNKKYDVSEDVFNIIKNNFEKVNILSIDRGERNLLYYTLIDTEGKILRQGSWNLLNDKLKRKIDYFEKIVSREKERLEERKNWEEIKNIKELKEGYLSQIIYEIYNLLIKYNAVLVLENLNSGFKRRRSAIERQIYQRFENQLISKLNYVVFKDQNILSPGGVLKGLQLTNKQEKKSNNNSYNGIIFYVSPSYTSAIDPTIGFINRIYPKYESIIQVKKLIGTFSEIKYSISEDMFVFKFKYSDFGFKDLVENDWEVYTNGYRYEWFRDENNNFEWNFRKVNLTEEFKKLLDNYKIEYSTGEDIKKFLLKENLNSAFYKEFVRLLNLTLRLRNRSDKEDFIISPVKNSEGKFFDSRYVKDEGLPENSDANGAYNIGIKGLIILNRLKDKKDFKNLKGLFKIELKDYVNFYLKTFSL